MRRTIAPLVAVALLSACGGKDKKEENPTPWIVDCKAGSATVTGSFLSPNGEVPIVGAEITLSTAPGCTTSTSQTGTFELDNVPPGAGTITGHKGRFHGSSTATPGTPVEVLIDLASASIAFVPGAWDTIQNVVSGLGFVPAQLEASQLATDLSPYDVLLLNCGLDESYDDDPDTLAALSDWVGAGGVLYASDYAAVYVDGAFPGKINFLSPDPYNGMAGEQTAQVVDALLSRALGKGTALIDFNLDAWVVVDSVSAGVQVLIRGPADTFDAGLLPNRPYALQFAAGTGRVTFTSFHEEAQTTADMTTLLQQMVLGL